MGVVVATAVVCAGVLPHPVDPATSTSQRPFQVVLLDVEAADRDDDHLGASEQALGSAPSLVSSDWQTRGGESTAPEQASADAAVPSETAPTAVDPTDADATDSSDAAVAAEAPESALDIEPEPVEAQPINERELVQTPPEPPDPVDELDEEEPSYRRFVYIEGIDEAEAVDADYIAARSRDAATSTRVSVSSRQQGERSLDTEGAQSQTGARVTQRLVGEPVDPAGSPQQPTETVVTSAPTGGGGGHRGIAVDGQAAPVRGGDRFEGGEAARRGGGGAPAASSSAGAAGAASRSGFAAAPNGRQAAQSAGNDFWQPAVMRFVPPRPAAPQQAPAVATPAPTHADGIAMVDRPGQASDRGGVSDETTTLEEAAPGPQAASGEAEPSHRIKGRLESLDELREALGFGTIDRSELAPRSAAPGVAGRSGNAPASPQTVTEEHLDIANVVFVSAEATPAARYAHRVHEILADRWYERDLSPEQKALGIQGKVTVVFVITPSGRTEQVRMLNSSGNTNLDQLALSAVPERLPKLPRRVGTPNLPMRWTFTYRNPLIVRDE